MGIMLFLHPLENLRSIYKVRVRQKWDTEAANARCDVQVLVGDVVESTNNVAEYSAWSTFINHALPLVGHLRLTFYRVPRRE